MISRGQVVQLEISDIAFGGKGIAKINSDQGEYVLFVPNTFPGQHVSARIVKKRKRFAECSLIEIIKQSEAEIELPFQKISGAPFIYIPIALQEKVKKETTLETYKRLGDLQNINQIFDQFISSPTHLFYRNKMEYSFACIEHDIVTNQEIDDSFALGFKHQGTWWKVENLNRPSGLFDEEWESKLPTIREFLKDTQLHAWHPPQKKGFYRHIVVRKSFFTNQLLINLVTSSEEIGRFKPMDFVDLLISHFGDRIAGIQHTINDNVADRAKIENGSTKLLFGESFIVEQILGLQFEISMESFFQTNPQSAEKLYQKAFDYLFEDLVHNSEEYVMDLFCGTGTIGQVISHRYPNINVIGIDIVAEAIADAKKNAQRNQIDKIKFYASDVGKFLSNFPNYNGKIKSIILDPPRAGIAPKTLQKVINLGGQRIVYISCNPATQARDAKILQEGGYELRKLSLVDQFPHTSHIEAIAVFDRQTN